MSKLAFCTACDLARQTAHKSDPLAPLGHDKCLYHAPCTQRLILNPSLCRTCSGWLEGGLDTYEPKRIVYRSLLSGRIEDVLMRRQKDVQRYPDAFACWISEEELKAHQVPWLDLAGHRVRNAAPAALGGSQFCPEVVTPAVTRLPASFSGGSMVFTSTAKPPVARKTLSEGPGLRPFPDLEQFRFKKRSGDTTPVGQPPMKLAAVRGTGTRPLPDFNQFRFVPSGSSIPCGQPPKALGTPVVREVAQSPDLFRSTSSMFSGWGSVHSAMRPDTRLHDWVQASQPGRPDDDGSSIGPSASEVSVLSRADTVANLKRQLKASLKECDSLRATHGVIPGHQETPRARSVTPRTPVRSGALSLSHRSIQAIQLSPVAATLQQERRASFSEKALRAAADSLITDPPPVMSPIAPSVRLGRADQATPPRSRYSPARRVSAPQAASLQAPHPFRAEPVEHSPGSSAAVLPSITPDEKVFAQQVRRAVEATCLAKATPSSLPVHISWYRSPFEASWSEGPPAALLFEEKAFVEGIHILLHPTERGVFTPLQSNNADLHKLTFEAKLYLPRAAPPSPSRDAKFVALSRPLRLLTRSAIVTDSLHKLKVRRHSATAQFLAAQAVDASTARATSTKRTREQLQVASLSADPEVVSTAPDHWSFLNAPKINFEGVPSVSLLRSRLAAPPLAEVEEELRLRQTSASLLSAVELHSEAAKALRAMAISVDQGAPVSSGHLRELASLVQESVAFVANPTIRPLADALQARRDLRSRAAAKLPPQVASKLCEGSIWSNQLFAPESISEAETLMAAHLQSNPTKPPRTPASRGSSGRKRGGGRDFAPTPPSSEKTLVAAISTAFGLGQTANARTPASSRGSQAPASRRGRGRGPRRGSSRGALASASTPGTSRPSRGQSRPFRGGRGRGSSRGRSRGYASGYASGYQA